MQRYLDTGLAAQIHDEEQEFGGLAVDYGLLAATPGQVKDLDWNGLRRTGLFALGARLAACRDKREQ
jgi:uncharacterized protein (UPF0264 family)